MTSINTMSPFSKILVGVDQSENSDRAFEYAVRLSKLSGAKVYLVYVIEIPPASGSFIGVSDLEKYFEEEAQKFLNSVVTRAAKQFALDESFPIGKIIQKGYPSKVILDLAKSIGVDLIVVGSRGLGSVKEFLLGSVSYAVARHAAIPVLIVK